MFWVVTLPRFEFDVLLPRSSIRQRGAGLRAAAWPVESFQHRADELTGIKSRCVCSPPQAGQQHWTLRAYRKPLGGLSEMETPTCPWWHQTHWSVRSAACSLSPAWVSGCMTAGRVGFFGEKSGQGVFAKLKTVIPENLRKYLCSISHIKRERERFSWTGAGFFMV